jgi:hypothetical protein
MRDWNVLSELYLWSGAYDFIENIQNAVTISGVPYFRNEYSKYSFVLAGA